MTRRILSVSVLLAGLVMSVPCQAQVEPALPAWNWDNPKADATPWVPSDLTIIEIGALALALDFYFGGRVSGAVYRAIVAGGRTLLGRPPTPAQVPAAVGTAIVR